MKPLFILLTVLSSFFAGATNHTDDIAPRAIKSFERTFSNASEVSWSFSENLYKASFQVAGQYASAYYNNLGELVVVTRNISPLQLPVVLLAGIKKAYAQQWVSDLIEVTDETGTYYFITLEDADQKLILKSEGATSWVKHQKLEK